MDAGRLESYSLPDDPALAEMSRALRDAGHWAWVVDDRWRLVYATDEIRLSLGGLTELAPFAMGKHLFGPERFSVSKGWRFGPRGAGLSRDEFAAIGGCVLADTPGGRDELRRLVDPSLRDIVDDLSPADPVALAVTARGAGLGEDRHVNLLVAVRVRDATGRLAGTALISKPAAGMAILGAMTSMGDLRHLERMQLVARAGRRPAALLFADLESSSPLARWLSTASYFALGRRLVSAADKAVIDAGGIVGRHVGDGIVAFFLVEHLGSESGAARACIAASRVLRTAVGEVAARSDLRRDEIGLRASGRPSGALRWSPNIQAPVSRLQARETLGDERPVQAVPSCRADPESGRWIQPSRSASHWCARGIASVWPTTTARATSALTNASKSSSSSTHYCL